MRRTIPWSVPRCTFPILLTLLLAAPPAHAQFRQHVINDDLTGEENRLDPTLAGLDDGGFLVFWSDFSRGQPDVLVRRFDAGLAAAGEPVLVNDDDGISAQTGILASAAHGGRFAVVWLDEREGEPSAYAQVYRTDTGQPVGSNLPLPAEPTHGVPGDLSITTRQDGVSLACWVESAFQHQRAYARMLGPDGTALSAPFEISTENPNQNQRFPTAAALPDGRWFFAWNEAAGTTFELRARLFTAEGTPVAASSVVLTQPYLGPDLGPDPALLIEPGHSLLVWNGATDGHDDIYGIRIDDGGHPLGERFPLRAASDPSRDNAPRLRARAGGGSALVWFGVHGGQTMPLCRLFGSDGAPVSDEIVLADAEVGDVVRDGDLLSLPSGDWIAAWSDDRSLSLQVYLRLLAPDGSPGGSVTPVWMVPASASQILPSIALLPNGRSVVAWGDLRNGTFNIFARFLDSAGVPRGQSFVVNDLPVARRYSGSTDNETYFANRPSIAASATGAFVVTWASSPGGGAKVLHGQLFDSDGQPVGENFQVADQVTGREPQSDPIPAMAPDGAFVVALHDNQGDTWGDEVRLQRFDAAGIRNGVPISAVDEAGHIAPQFSPAIAISPYGDMVVAWTDRRRGNWDIYEAHLGPDGQPLEPSNQLMNIEDGPGDDQFNPSVATNGTAIVTVWDDRPASAGLIRGTLEIIETLARPETAAGGRSARDGQAAPIQFAVNQFDHPPGQKYPRVAIDASGRFVVTWWDERDGQRRVWAQRYAADGAPIGDPYSIIGGETHGIRAMTVVAADLDGIQYAWGDARRSRGWDIYGRRVDWLYGGETTPVLLESWDATSLDEGLRLRWEVPLDVTGAFYRAWRDPAAGVSDDHPTADAVIVSPGWIAASDGGIIEVVDTGAPRGETVRYFLESSVNGAPGEFFGSVEARWDPPGHLWSAGPNPFHAAVALVPPGPGPARVEIFDPAGRRVRVLERAGGSAPLDWNGLDDAGNPAASGVFLARVTADGYLSATLRLVRLR